MSKEVSMSSGTTTLSWESCPEEILRIIFKKLPLKCLLSCMTVNRRWKDIVIDYTEFHYLWPKMVSETMVNMGRTFQRKSVLSFKDIVMNSMLWPCVSLAKIELHYRYPLQNITRMHVYKENLIVRVDAQVKYFHITNTVVTKTYESSTEEIDYTENDYMVVIFCRGDESLSLSLYGKASPDDTSFDKKYIVNNILLYKLEDNICYIITNRYIVWALIWNRKNWDLKSRGRYYGNSLDTICGIYVFNETVSMVTKLGFILRENVKLKSFHKVNSYNRVARLQDATNLILFNPTDIVVSVPRSIRRIEVCQDLKSNHITIKCGDMTCATEHGEVLFIGYKDGAVAICTPHIMSLTHCQLDQLFYVQDFDKSIKDPCILALDVFEDKLSHLLLVATRHTVLQLLITYPDHIRAYYE